MASTAPEDDTVYGAYIQARPWLEGWIQLHWTHIEDKYLYGNEEDNLYALEFWHNLEERFQIHALYSRLYEDERDLLLRINYYDHEHDLIVQGSYYELLSTQGIHTIDFDPYFASLKEYYPYRQANFTISKGWGERFEIDGGIFGRMLSDKNDESEFNHEFIRYFVTFYLYDLPVEGMEAGATGEVWESYTEGDKIISGDVEAGYLVNDKFKFSVGTDYSLYKYDYYLDSEQNEVRTYYSKLRYTPLEGLAFNLNYQFESDNFDRYHRLETGFKVSF